MNCKMLKFVGWFMRRLGNILLNILNIHKLSISNCVTENSIHVIMENI